MHQDKDGPGIYPEFSYWTPIYRCITCIITETRRRDISDHSLIRVFLKSYHALILKTETKYRDMFDNFLFGTTLISCIATQRQNSQGYIFKMDIL